MPFDLEKQIPDSQLQSRTEITSMVLLAALIVASLIISFFIGGVADKYPSASRIVLRINHNTTSGYDWTNEYFQGRRSHNLSDIKGSYDRAAGYADVALFGGEIDGVTVTPLRSPLLRKEMEKIAVSIQEQKHLAMEYLSPELTQEKAADISNLFDAHYLESGILDAHFSAYSQSFLQRHRTRLEGVRYVLMVLAVVFVLAILYNTRKLRREKAVALELVRRIEERKDLAIEGASLGTWDWNIVTGEISFNQRWVEMLGLDPESVTPNYDMWEKLVHPDDLPRVLEELESHLSGESPRLFCEFRMWAEPGHWIWILDLGKVLERDEDGKPLRAAGTNLDITQLKSIELKLLSESERAQQYLDLTETLFVTLDNNGIVTMANRKACQVLGVPEDHVLGRNWIDTFVPERIREKIISLSTDLLDEDYQDSGCFINPVMTACGDEALISWSNKTLHDGDGNHTGYLSSGMDITRQRSYERELESNQRRLRSLASQLAMAEDRLRQDIASGLHDSIGQNLVALKLSIDLLGLNLDTTDISTVRQNLVEASDTIDKMVRETWSLSFQLSPPGLHEAGIRSALEWLVSKYNEKYNCEFVLTPSTTPLPRDKDGRGLLFQMVRELILNAVKHGQPTKVEISLSLAEQFILATVVDNGLGFDKTAAMAGDGNVGGFGLFSIRERLAYISGSLEIDSTVGKGARIVIRFPREETVNLELEHVDENKNSAG